MAPYFETAKSFAEVPITEDGVETASFLLAATDFLNMFDLLGSSVFGFVQSDMRSNLAGVRERYEAHTSKSTTLEKLVLCESQEHRGHATACLVRLIRGLLFTCQALQNMQSDKSSELHTCFKQSYDVVLGHQHTFLVRSAVSLAMRAIPNRRDFYDRITQGGSHKKFDAELAKWLVGLETIVKRMRAFLEQGGYGKV
ncbi:glycolipid transfer protein [Laetiporus sulphureus 93-53]|uniref:Glycolipid transfer protein n=1 Tax=Laetiporus sulphureus 93-53 TaxID=1314785 RepID=A0A165B9S2_9APHY|nr:glycolipid transfer protein [Laetiporus sulphureus 93-53]KZT00574.1 glycolipid transfer protein [Laetiporus sulphureus 93-53]